MKFCRGEIGEIVRYLSNQKIRLPLKLSLLPKICWDQLPKMYSECARFHPNRFTYGGVIAEGVNTAKFPNRVD